MTILTSSGWLGQENLTQSDTSERSALQAGEEVAPLPACRCFQCRSNGGQASRGSGTGLPFNSTARTGNLQMDALLSGFRWNTPVITYSFFSGGSYYGSETGTAPVSEAVKANVRNIIQNIIEPLLNVRFQEVADSAAAYGQMRFLFSNGPGYAYAYYPFANANQGTRSDVAGDVHLNPRYIGAQFGSFEAGAGTYGFETLIHEILHALGLKHPGNYNGSGPGTGPFLPFAQDNNSNTVMTYNNAGASASSLMSYDIRALQFLYGASFLNAGDTTYQFTTVFNVQDGTRSWGSALLPSKLTLWDSGGIDTLDFSQLAADPQGYQFDLNEGGFLTARAAFNSVSYRAVSDTTANLYLTSSYGTAIAFGTVFENLLGSSSDDTILGNAVSNALHGHAGNDSLLGSLGADSLWGGEGADTLGGGPDNDQLRGGRGNDLLRGGRGDDWLDGGNGDDQLVGGLGGDRFFLHLGEDIDTILDFQDGFDRLELGSNLQFGDLTLTQWGSDTQIAAGSDVLATLLNVNTNLLTVADFV